ncbi:MAG: SurA N-terminal domain-containing protein [Smithellaceae bacterium]|nr:SurA N-terminal domain-containing protein [Smithellaceae bacterium]
MNGKIREQGGGEGSVDEAVHRPDCDPASRHKNRKRLWYWAAAGMLVILGGSVVWYGETFSWDALTGKPAAIINGEPVTRSEARERFKIRRVMLEKQYGKDIFTGEGGKALLGDLEREVLEMMMDERLVTQEARRLNIGVSEEMVRQKIQNIAREIYGSWDNFNSSLREDGISEEYLLNHIRNLLIRQEVIKAKAPPEADPEAYFGAWLIQARQAAKVTFKQTVTVQPSSRGQGSCCGPGGGGCGGKQASAGPLDPAVESKASAIALAEYLKTNPAEKGVKAKVTDYGCHIQVDIEKGGRLIRSYAYQDGRVIAN